MSERRCASCDKVLVRRVIEPLYKFGKRKFCSHPCAVEARKKPIALRPCCICGKSIPPSSKVSASTYLTVKTCSRHCASILSHRTMAKRGVKTGPPPAPKPKPINETPEHWLETHEITKCPPAILLPTQARLPPEAARFHAMRADVVHSAYLKQRGPRTRQRRRTGKWT